MIGVGLVGVGASRLAILVHHFRGQAMDVVVGYNCACNVIMLQGGTIFVGVDGNGCLHNAGTYWNGM